MRIPTNMMIVTTCIMSLLSPAVPATVAPEIANPGEAVEVPATKLVKSDLFADTAYQLDPTATIYRARAFYELTGPTGKEVVVSTRQLLARLDEINAVATLEKMEKTSVYVDAVKKAGMAPVDLAKNLVSEPVDTVSRIGRGVGGFFSDIGYAIAGDDPDQENVAKTAVGFGAAKRAFAYELGVNPYSDFQPLQEAIGEIAWTAVGGSFSVSMGFRAVGGTPSTALSLSKTANGMRKLVRDKSPREIRKINEDKLAAMGVGASLSEAFLSNHDFDPETETRLVGALDSMGKVAGRERFIKRAALVNTPADARMMRDWAELMAAYHEQIQKITEISVVSSAPLAVTEDRVTHIIYPADYLTPSPGFQDRMQAIMADIKRRELTPGQVWVTGEADPKAVKLLQEVGWKEVRSRVDDKLYAR